MRSKMVLGEQGGLSFTEFTYQVFQAYDWHHLFQEHGCTVQIGAIDQMGNIATGHEYTTRYFHGLAFESGSLKTVFFSILRGSLGMGDQPLTSDRVTR